MKPVINELFEIINTLALKVNNKEIKRNILNEFKRSLRILKMRSMTKEEAILIVLLIDDCEIFYDELINDYDKGYQKILFTVIKNLVMLRKRKKLIC